MDKPNNQINIMADLIPFAINWLTAEIDKKNKIIKERQEEFKHEKRMDIYKFECMIRWFNTLVQRAKNAKDIMEMDLIISDFSLYIWENKIFIFHLHNAGQCVGLDYKSKILEKLQDICAAISQNPNAKFNLIQNSGYEIKAQKNIINKLKSALEDLECDPNTFDIQMMDTSNDSEYAKLVQKEQNH